jgi:hypothetical protein
MKGLYFAIVMNVIAILVCGGVGILDCSTAYWGGAVIMALCVLANVGCVVWNVGNLKKLKAEQKRLKDMLPHV